METKPWEQLDPYHGEALGFNDYVHGLKDHAKEILYQQGYAEFFNNENPRVTSRLEGFVKVDELFYEKARGSINPRMIFNPPRAAKAVTSWVNHTLIQIMRQDPGFIVGYNTDELTDILTKSWNELEDPVAITWDGSKFDSHQHAAIRRLVDLRYLDFLLPTVLERLAIDPLFW